MGPGCLTDSFLGIRIKAIVLRITWQSPHMASGGPLADKRSRRRAARCRSCKVGPKKLGSRPSNSLGAMVDSSASDKQVTRHKPRFPKRSTKRPKRSWAGFCSCNVKAEVKEQTCFQLA